MTSNLFSFDRAEEECPRVAELIAIEKGLNYVDNLAEPVFKSISILTDSHSSVQHFVAAVAEWYRHRIVAGFVTSSSPVPLKTRRHTPPAKAASLDIPWPTLSMMFSSSKKKQRDLWKVPPEDVWYPQKHSGGALLFEGNRGQADLHISICQNKKTLPSIKFSNLIQKSLGRMYWVVRKILKYQRLMQPPASQKPFELPKELLQETKAEQEISSPAPNVWRSIAEIGSCANKPHNHSLLTCSF
ncbi:hypothetical protein TNCV_254221 [Trichonephila clavipes]|nr:hypothetical protein TNCV_254221 [Trichonephila clavipes]